MFSIDLRNEFKEMLRDFGFNVLLVRNIKHTRCKCYDSLHTDGDRKCKICGGSGNLNSLEVVNTICQNASSGSFVKMSELGLKISNTVVFYLDYKTVPKERDQIFLVGYDKNNIPIDIKYDCTIVAVKPVRGDRGRIEFFEVMAEISPEKIIQDQRRLNSTALSTKQKIMKGKRLIWKSSY